MKRPHSPFSSEYHYIQIGIHITEDMRLKAVSIDDNTTEVPSDSGLIREVAEALLKLLDLNKENIAIQDLLTGLDITLPLEE